MKKLLCVSVLSFLQCGDGYACSIPVPGVECKRMHLKEELNVSEVLDTLSEKCPIIPSVGTSSQIARGNMFIKDVFWDAMHAITGYTGEKSTVFLNTYLFSTKDCETFKFIRTFLRKALSSNDIRVVFTVAYSKMTGIACPMTEMARTTTTKMPFYSPKGTCGAKEYNQQDVRYIFSGIRRRLDRLHELERSGNSNDAEYTAGKMQIAKLMGLLIQGYNESPAEIYAAHTACVSELLQSEKLDNISWQNCLKALVIDMLLETRSKLFKFAILKHDPRYIDNIFDNDGIKDENIEAYTESCMAELGAHQLLEGMYGINAPQGNPFTDTYPETMQNLLIYLLNARRNSANVRRAQFALAVDPKTKKWGAGGAREFCWSGEPLTKKSSLIGYGFGGLHTKQKQYDNDSLVSAKYHPVAFVVTHEFVPVEPAVSFPVFSTHFPSSFVGLSQFFFHPPVAPSLLLSSPDSPPFAPPPLPPSPVFHQSFAPSPVFHQSFAPSPVFHQSFAPSPVFHQSFAPSLFSSSSSSSKPLAPSSLDSLSSPDSPPSPDSLSSPNSSPLPDTLPSQFFHPSFAPSLFSSLPSSLSSSDSPPSPDSPLSPDTPQPVAVNMTVAEYKDVLKQLCRGVVGDTLNMVNLLLDSPLAEITINRYLEQDGTSLQELSSNIKCSCGHHDDHARDMKANLLTVMLVKASMMNGHFSYASSCV